MRYGIKGFISPVFQAWDCEKIHKKYPENAHKIRLFMQNCIQKNTSYPIKMCYTLY